jgi:hypothetical protein
MGEGVKDDGFGEYRTVCGILHRQHHGSLLDRLRFDFKTDGLLLLV